MCTLGQSQRKFELVELADELLSYTMKICGKNVDGKTYRFPLYLYPNYVTAINDTVITIHKDIIIANESRNPTKRKRLQEDVLGQCTYLNHLIRHARDNRWISEKQLNNWRKIINSIYWKTRKWIESDKKQ